ncbi:MAG: AAA family ATPase [Myxococcales bacterium]|nr:AAA family ATPase [Myxococcales bacterium]
MSPPDTAARFGAAAAAFRKFFFELRDVFLEREALFTQIELALLCREHVLVTGPPGTAKSAIASAVLGRISDEKSGEPSLFAKQLSESTVQSDLVGPVDFKVLQDTGRTEYITDDGMLGATHAFLDEVFDGRDMLLRSILNVLHERELKHGRKVTAGRCECAIMTSNRYLSEVLARSPELLLAFADRLSFICFCPKSFARASSRAAMLATAAKGQRPDLKASLTLQQLDVLQASVDRVEVGSLVREGLELLADAVERELQAQVVKLPDYVPTKYFSQRSTVKALWALKAAVVRDRIYRRPERPLEARVEDLDWLRYFFLLGGPAPAETELLLKSAADPRERAQLEIIRLEHKSFEEALAKVRSELASGIDREAAALDPKEEQAAADSMLRSFQAVPTAAAARSLREKLVPGPRHPQNRLPLAAAARTLVAALEQRLARGMAGQGEGRGGAALMSSLLEVMGLCRAVPELSDRLEPVAKAAAGFCRQALEMASLSAESTEFDEAVKLEALSGLAANLDEELSQVDAVADQLAVLVPGRAEELRAAEKETRARAASSIRRRVASAFERGHARGDPLESLAVDSRRLSQLEAALVGLSSEQAGLKQELLQPLGAAYAREVLSSATFERVEQYSRVVQTVSDNLRREGLSPEPLLAENHDVIEQRLRDHAQVLSQPVRSPHPEAPQVLNGEAYLHYRQELAAAAPDGELTALASLESLLATTSGGPAISSEVKESVASVELAFAQARVRFLRAWLSQLLTSLPSPDELSHKAEAERAFDRLVKSRFPLLATKEGELVRLKGTLELLCAHRGPISESAKKLEQALRGVAEDFASFSKRLLDARARL